MFLQQSLEQKLNKTANEYGLIFKEKPIEKRSTSNNHKFNIFRTAPEMPKNIKEKSKKSPEIIIEY